MATDSAMTGGCLCGAIRYSVGAKPTRAVHCHCSLCRRASGAPYMSWFLIPAASFSFSKGKPTAYASSERAVRQHCAACGTQLTFKFNSRPDFMVVTIASLDNPSAVTPTEHVFWEDRVPSLVELEGLAVRKMT